MMAKKRSTQVEEKMERPKSENRAIPNWRLAGVVVIVVAVLLSLTWRTPRKQMRDELVGRWHTTAPGYVDRTFELDNICISFTTGEGGISVGFIKDLAEVPAGPDTLYTISYTVDGVPNVVSFYYSQNDQRLWFKNQDKIIWTKDKNS